MHFKRVLVLFLTLISSIISLSCSTDSNERSTTILTSIASDIYNISFDSQGGTLVSSQQVLSEELATQPDVPHREEYEFLGWYISTLGIDNQVPFDFDSPITSNLTLYASWARCYDVVESSEAVFVVEIDHAEISSIDEYVTISVEITAKTSIDIEMYTSSYGENGIIQIRVIGLSDDSIFLYSQYYDVQITTDILEVHLDAFETMSRSIQFGILPFHGGMGGELPSPEGTYKVQVCLFSHGWEWIDTGIVIKVRD